MIIFPVEIDGGIVKLSSTNVKTSASFTIDGGMVSEAMNFLKPMMFI
ncbi:MAG: hypothetical protein OWQ54_00375 [Sulfolobaceae archaeon]|nr:hypothetical protein [Sulfolobaceae archaeon]